MNLDFVFDGYLASTPEPALFVFDGYLFTGISPEPVTRIEYTRKEDGGPGEKTVRKYDDLTLILHAFIVCQN